MRAGICTLKCKVVHIRCEVAWLSKAGVRGICLGPFILFSMPAEEVPQYLFRHELEHHYQQLRDGRVWFHLKYIYWSLRHGYTNNPYEVEARAKANNPLTTSEEQALWKLREN